MSVITPDMLAKSGSEDGEQAAFFCYAVTAARTDYRWKLFYAIANGGSRGDSQQSRNIRGSRLAATGVKSGFPDIGLSVAVGGFHALYIEMKRRKVPGRIVKADGTRRLIGGGKVQPEQETWHCLLNNEGNAVAVCYGWNEAVAVALAYLEGVDLSYYVDMIGRTN